MKEFDALYKHMMWMRQKDAQRMFRWLNAYRKIIVKTPASTEYEHKIDDFMKPVYEKLHSGLTQFKFANGDMEKNEKNHVAQVPWWLYTHAMNCIYIQPCMGDHHAPASQRKQALLNDVDIVILLMKRIFKEE